MKYNEFRFAATVIFAFSSTEGALEAEEALNAAGFRPALSSLPTQLGLGCGTGIRLDHNKMQSALNLLAGKGIAVDSVWQQDEKEHHWLKIWG